MKRWAMLLSLLAAPAIAQEPCDPAPASPARELVGSWNGGLEQGGAVVLRLGLVVTEAPCGQVAAALDSPDQGARGIPTTGLTLAGDSVTFQVPSVGGSFRGVLDASRTRINGTWSQGGNSLGMSLSRSETALSATRPQDPTPPYPYAEVEVSYTNPADGTTLAGTLTRPPGEGPFPAVLLLTGSGAQDRNETLMGHRPFLVIADYLTRRGIAVLRVDDRGVGGSSGNTLQAKIPDNVGDAAAGVAFLRAQPGIDPARVGLIGHSEGGWVAPALAAQSGDVAFVVLLAGPAVAPYDLLLAQGRALARGAGLDSATVEAQVGLTGRLLEIIRAEADDERAMAAMRTAAAEWAGSLPASVSAEYRAQVESPQAREQFEQSLRTNVTPWFRGLLTYDPAPALQALKVPALALYGEKDLQVPAAQSVPMLERLWAGKSDATIRVLPGLNHLFQHARTGVIAEYAAIEETFAPEALAAMGDWIAERFVR